MPPSADPLPDLGPFPCYADIPAANVADVTGETTDCGGPVTVTFIGDSPNPGCAGTVIRTYQLADTCGVTTNIQQNIFLNDNIAPTADPLPALGPFSCYADIPAPNVNAVTGESDNCGGVVTVSHAGDSPNPGCSGTVTRSYLLADACGNTALITQTITIADIIPPVIISCPADITASCPADVPAPNPGSVTWSDNCGIATVTHVDDESLVDFQQNGIYCTSYLERTYRVTDLCGNFVQCQQLIMVQDICQPQYDCPTCEEIVPHFDVDFTENPDSSWISPPVVREGTCCAQIGPPPPRCIHFTLTLPPSVVAISFNIESGAQPSGSLFYQIDCNEVHQVGDTICLLGDATYELTFCKPGSNENEYSITAFSGNIIPDTIHTQVDCAAEMAVEGIVESTAVWNDITGGGQYNSYLSCLAGCLTTTFTPDSNAPPFILYEVCGDRGALVCGLSAIICDTILAVVHPKIVASINPNPAIYCEDDIGTLTGSVTPPGTYSMQWYNGPNGTGSVVGSGPNYTPSASGAYSFVVSDLVNDYVCGEDTANVQVTIVPLPQFELGQDTSVCTEAIVNFDLPNGPQYNWVPSTGVAQGGDPSQFIITASNTTSYTVTAVTPEGCEWTDTWSINVVSCTVDCPEQTHCSSSDIIIYQTVPEFLTAGGSISLPCNIQAGSISLVSNSTDGLSCPETITHTYEIEDDCGNTETCDVLIILNDTIPPIWTSNPAAIGPLSCIEAIPMHENLTATDNCAYIINTSIDPYEPDFCNGYSITLRWTLTDSCGNNAPDQTLVVNFLPQEPPVFIDPPGDSTIVCDNVDDIIIPDLSYDNGQVGNCQITGVVPGMLNGPINECGGQFTIEWNYTDTCGRSITYIQTVTVTDDVDPVITCPVNLDFECNADVPPAFISFADFTAAGGAATDNCGLMISSFAVSESDNGTCPRTITRTYSIADSCGNTAQCVQTITVDDQENPVITCPGDLMFECSGDVPPAFTSFDAFINGGGSANDNCGLIETSFTIVETESGTCPLIITRTYSIADSCGNSSQCVQTITVDDQENPVITCPAGMTFACSGDVPAAFTTFNEFISGGGSASDNCGLVESSFSVTETNSGTCPQTITRTYSIADSCGNTGQCVQIITVDDQENPVITCPGNQTFECTGDLPPVFTSYTDFINGGGTASDNCELVESSFSVTETTSGNCPRTVTRTYSIADLCGNTGQCVQTIIIDDTTPPVITCPANVNGECSGDIPPAFTTLADFLAGGGSASDNCALDPSSFSMNETDDGICPRIIIRIYSIADSCGNTSQCVQTINIDDTTPPVITCPGNVNEECSVNIPPVFSTLAGFVAGGGSASDNCALDASTFTVTESDNGTCPRTIIRTYQIADSCGNTGQCVQTIIVDDTTPPVITCPANVNEECTGNVTPAYTTFAGFIAGGGTASDNCALDESSFSVTETDEGICPRTITRVYEIADSCGNTGQCIQTIIVDDPEPPVVTCPADLNFECVGDVPPSVTTFTEFINSGGNATDNCIINESTFSVTESSSGLCPRIITRTYSIEDSCGNLGQCVQTITIDDPQPPVVTCPADLDFECIGDVPPAPATYNDFINDGGSATDNCGIDVSTFSVTESASGMCPKIIVRTYSIADSCGNTGQCVQTITIDDPQPPVMTCPADLNLECVGDIPPVLANYTDFINGGGSATDNCGINESTFTVSESASGICPKIIVRTYAIADSCGNTTQCVQTITVDDSTPPVITCPGNINDECTGNIPPAFTTLADFLNGGGSASDNCALDPTSFSMSETDGGTCPRIIARTYSIADSCGNTAQCVQTISIDDTTPPVITCPGDVNEECSGNIPPVYTTLADFIAGGGSASDNCALDASSFAVTESDNGICPRTIIRTYQIADSCGNTGQCVQTIVIDDTTPPVITCPGAINEECSGNVTPAFTTLSDFIAGGGTVADNCALDESSFTFSETDNGTCPRTITRTYEIADSCGNTGQCVQTIIVNDPEPPVVTCPADLNFECIGDVPPPVTTYTEFINSGGNATDNCIINESSFSVTESSSGLCPRIITRTYSIEDSCGNLGQCVQTITIDDPQPPAITCPGDLEFECVGDVPPAPATFNDFINSGGSATDNCGIDESTFSVTESASGMCPQIIIRTYSIADSCGNTGQCVQTITIDDPQPPVMTCPADLNLECVGDIPPLLANYMDFINGGGSATDNCGINESTFTASESVSGICPKIIVRTYAIADSCGNTTQCVQTITVDDSTPPLISCPDNVNDECGGSIPPAFNTLADFLAGGGSASDNCALDTSSFSMNETDAGTCPRTITRTYTIADSCGNEGQCVQTIVVDDPIAPVLTCPGDLMFECTGDIPALLTTYADFINGGGSASDNCALDISSFMATETDNGTCPRTITRTYSIADSCGNIGECVQTITVDDQVDPVITCPEDLVLECSGDIPPALMTYTEFINGGGTASDNCSLDESTFTATETDNGNCPRTITRTYSIADSCGNMAQCMQTITVDDQIDPVITCPGDLMFECTGDVPPLANTFIEFINAGGSASDNCALDESSFAVTESDNGTCPRTITRTYSIADSCGHIAQCVQTITVDDQVDPVITCPGDLTLECSGDIPPAFTTYADFVAGGGSASDNCDLDEATFSLSESDNGICPRTILRTYAIADSCGNTGQCVQTITVDDDINPTASDPAPITIECTGEVPPPDPSLVNDAADNCSVPVVAFVSDESDGGICPEVITRIYSVTDECGNQILVTQIITIGDDEDPTASSPAPIMIECIGEAPPPDPSLISASDNCSVPVVAFVSDESDGGICPETITRTYSVTDECGNQILVTQIITIGDEIPPTASDPGPLTIECNGEVPAPDPSLISASDNCSVPVVAFVGDESDGGICPEIITRTYSVTDECDNQILVTQTITIGDEIPPTASNPAPITVAVCNAPIPVPDISLVTDASDNCSTPVVDFLGDATSLEGCTETTIRSYSVTDACDNSITVEQIITRTVDFTPPVFINVPENLTFECETELPPIPELEYTDNCSPGDTVAGTETGPVGDPPVITWTWTATDDCGNSTSVSVTITITENPTVTNLTDEFCTGDIYVLPDSSTTTVGGMYGPYIFTGSTGCDSIVNLDLNGIDPVIITITDDFCEGDIYTLPDSTTTSTGGSYGPFNFVTEEGCDSTVFVELTLIPTVYTDLNDEFCEGTTYVLPDGSTTTVGGSFGPFEFVSQDGCDSIVNLDLVELPQVINDLSDEFCTGDIYTLPDGSTTTTGGVYGPYVYTSANGCDSIVNLTLTETGPPNVEINDEGPVCISSGIITLTATPPGGIWSGVVNSDQFDPLILGVGTHEVIYTVTSGECENADTIQIIVYELVLSCEALTEESFPGAGDGTASVTISGGVPPYSVVWTGPVSDSVTLNMDDTFIITSLTAGVYTVVVEDAEGCIATCEFTIIAIVPCELTIEDILPKAATCPGVNNGSITVDADGNMPPFEYSLDGINYQSSNVFDLLAPGTYTVYVKDNADCMQSQSVIVDVGEGPELSILEIVDASCGVNNGSIEVSVSGGSPPYQYSIDGVAYGLSSLFPGLDAGDYLVYLIDEAGCTDTIPASVGASDAPVIVNIIVVDASCGLADGSITIEANGGLGVLMYSINGGFSYQISPVFNGLTSGTFAIVVKDEADCQVTGIAIIQETGGPVIDAIVATPTGCGQSDGTITITATGIPVLQYSINGTHYQTSGIFQGLAAGVYTVSVKDGNGCIVIGQVTLNTTDGPLIQNIQHTNTKCGLEDGTITISASGGTGEIEYLLNGESYGDQNFIEDLPAGNYTIEVIDENGCSATDQVTINSSEGPDFDVYITPAHCGMADGIIELDGTGGTPPYTYSINGSSFSANFTFVNKPSEYYIVKIKDANGCIYEEEVFIWETTGPEIADVVVTDPDCGMNNGTIEITATGTDLQYSILTPPAFQSTPQFDSVAPGTYTVVIKDKFGCRDQSTAVIAAKPLPAISVTPTDSECGMSSGSIMVNATEGTPPFMYKIGQGTFSSSNFFGSLPAGNYTVTVQGANGCEASESVTINADGVQVNALSAAICEGGIYVLHGNEYSTSGNYSITLQGGASNGCDSVINLSLEVTPLHHNTIQGILCPGEVYTINGVDYSLAGQYIVDTIPGLSGCDTILSLDLMVGDYESKYLDAGICQGEVYNIGGVDFDTAGEYVIDTIAVTSGCDSILILRLEVNPLPEANAGADHVLDCEVQSVVLDGSAIGGEPFWTGPGIHAGNENQLKPQVTQPGVYTLTVISPEQCTQEDEVVVDVDPSTVIADAGPDAFLSCDITTIMLQAAPVGPDLIYQWSGPGINSQNEHMVNPVIAVPGIYTLVVTNTSTGCVSLPDSLVITDITTDVIAIVQDPNSLDCFSTFIDLNATGSSSGSNLIYIWFNSDGEIIGTTSILKVSSGGIFTFLVKDTISGCFDMDTVSVTDLIAYPPVDAGDPQQIDCYQGTVVLNEGAQNNLLNLVFLWTGPPGGIIGPDSLLSVIAGSSGMYYLEAEDTITGCKNIDSVMVTDISDQPVADIRVVETITCIDSLALLNTGQSSSGPEITYSWSGPGVNGITTTFIEPLSAGLYTLTVLNTLNGCVSIDTVILELPPPLLDLETIIEVPICEGDASGSISVTNVTGGVPEYMYGINGQPLQSSPLFENLIAGVYAISVIDGNGCTYSESLTLPDGITLTIDIGIDIELVLGDSITLSANVSLPWSQVDSLVWTPAEILSCTYCINPVLYGLHDNVITATVYSGGCLAEDMISLRVDVNAEIYIPNVFSPNGDGVNDHVTVFTDPRVKRVVRLEIFDRWGNQVFVGEDFPPNDPLLGWDGTFREKPMNPAVFAYVALVELINGDYVRRKGDITLIR